MPIKSLLSPRVLPGLIIVAAGVVLLLDSFDVIDFGDLWRYWPLLLVAFGLHLAIEGGNRTFGAILAGVGAVLQADKLGLLNVNLTDVIRFWPLILIGLGAKMLIRPAGKDNSVWGVILVALGAYFFGHNFGWIDFALYQLWPIALIAAGIGMLRRAMAARN